MNLGKRLLLLCIFYNVCFFVPAHPGRTDSNGGHNGPNGYHYHNALPSTGAVNIPRNNQTIELATGNETGKDFVQGTVLAQQLASPPERSPKLEIGFVGRKDNSNNVLAYLLFRFNSSNITGGGIFNYLYTLNRNTNKLERGEGNSLRQFISLLYDVIITVEISQMRGVSSIDSEIGEIELYDFQWYSTQNSWKTTRDKICRLKVKVLTVNNENRLYFYQTSSLIDYRNNQDTFAIPNSVYLTESQCQQIIDAYESENSFLWNAVNSAINSIR
jgi:hypothetical protein